MFTYPIMSAGGGGGGSPPVLESYTLVNNGNGSTSYLRVTMPSGVASGDVLLIFVTNSTTAILGDSFGAVSGWTKEATTYNNALDAHFVWYWRIATGGEASYYDVPWSNTSQRLKGGCLRVSGADTTTPWDTALLTQAGSGSAFTVPALPHTASVGLSVMVGGGSYNNAAGGTYTEASPDWSFLAQQASSYGNCFIALGPEDLGGGTIPAFTMNNASSWAGYNGFNIVFQPPQ